ncbi:MAG: hypothetical protein J6P45_09335 [Lachnospiraceae bacterium]|nr:hypothetical protein [Lachnospiraceae bacterium]
MILALDTIDKVLKAEQEADGAEKNAIVEADRIVAKAEDDAIGLKSDLSRKAKSEADEAVRQAKDKADGLLSKAKEETGESVQKLRAETASKEEAAIKLILDSLT